MEVVGKESGEGFIGAGPAKEVWYAVEGAAAAWLGMPAAE